MGPAHTGMHPSCEKDVEQRSSLAVHQGLCVCRLLQIGRTQPALWSAWFRYSMHGPDLLHALTLKEDCSQSAVVCI
jgi:hypothetical protein